MDIINFEQRLHALLLNHINEKYDIDEYLELLKYENSSILNYILSHAYYASGDLDNADKYRKKAVSLNSNFDFEADYANITAYIYIMFCTITTLINPFMEDEIEGLLGETPSEADFMNTSEAYRNINDISNALRITHSGQNKFPESVSLKYDLASNLLYTRLLDNAWEYNELRFDAVRDKLPQYIKKPKFLLQKTSAKVYIYPVTKIGDTIFFTRYIFELKNDYPNLKLFVSPNESLKQLFEENGIRTYDKPDKSIIDYQVSFEGLPYLYKDKGSKVLSKGYLNANKKKSEQYKEQYFDNSKLKVGIVWRTSVPDDKRNVPIELFKDLFKIDGIQFYSLERDITLQEEMLLATNLIPNFGIKLNDFSDTAAIIDNLDIVIGCDTSVTNLAGAMGKKTLILLPYHADWRWGLFEQKSEWYESAELFRQKTNNDYKEVLDRVEKYLENCLLENTNQGN